MLKIRRPLGRLIFNMGIAIPGKTVFLIETAPRSLTMANFTLFISSNIDMNSQHNGVDAFHSANGRHSFSAACLCVIGGKVRCRHYKKIKYFIFRNGVSIFTIIVVITFLIWVITSTQLNRAMVILLAAFTTTHCWHSMIASWHENAFRITGLLWGWPMISLHKGPVIRSLDYFCEI